MFGKRLRRRYIAGLDHDTFINDDKTIDSVVRNLEIISQSPPREFYGAAPRARVAQNHRPQKSHRPRLFQYRRRNCLGDPSEGFTEIQMEAFPRPHVTEQRSRLLRGRAFLLVLPLRHPVRVTHFRPPLFPRCSESKVKFVLLVFAPSSSRPRSGFSDLWAKQMIG
jgi:hypothetical protein